MSFRNLLSVVPIVGGFNGQRLGREPVFTQAQTHLGVPQGVPRAIALTDVLWLFHSRTDVAKMCLSPGTGDSAWQATGPIICDRGDTLGPGAK